MSDLNALLSAGYAWRELWFPELINNHATLPKSADGGQPLALTGARKGSSVDGVYFDGSATSNMKTGADPVLDNQAKFWICIRFKLDQTFVETAGNDFYLFQKLLVNEWVRIYLKGAAAAADRKLYFEQGDGGGTDQFVLTSTTYTWTAGVWYTVIAYLTDTGAAGTQGLLIDGTIEDSDVAAARPTPNGGDLIVGSSSDGGADGVKGDISWVVVGTDELTQRLSGTNTDLVAGNAVTQDTTGAKGLVVGAAAGWIDVLPTNGIEFEDTYDVKEDTDPEDLLTGTTVAPSEWGDLYKGIPPSDAVNMYLLDEGRGTTCTDRGSGADDATLDTACTWDFGTVKLAALSLNGINDRTTSSAGVDISGAISLIAVVKAKSTYDSLAASHEMVRIRVDDSNLIQLHYFQTDDSIRIYAIGAAAAGDVDYTTKPTIDDYLIFIATLTLAGTLSLYVNGAYIGQATGVGAISGLAATADIGSIHTGGEYDVSKPLLVGLVSGALPGQEAREVSRRIDSRFDLGVAI